MESDNSQYLSRIVSPQQHTRSASLQRLQFDASIVQARCCRQKYRRRPLLMHGCCHPRRYAMSTYACRIKNGLRIGKLSRCRRIVFNSEI